MGRMGLGYGSEYQLLRFLGHHRNYLNEQISKQSGINGEIEWEDYPSNQSSSSLDGEYVGIEFLKNRSDFETIESKWKDFWAQKGNAQNWDGIFYSNGIIYLVEAKGHLKIPGYDSELESSTSSDDAKIQNSLTETQNFFGINTQNDWKKNYYQQANRLAFIYFLNEICGIKAELVNIFFINGFDKKDEGDFSVKSKEEWQKAIDDEYEYLGLTDKAKSFIHEVFIDCKENL